MFLFLILLSTYMGIVPTMQADKTPVQQSLTTQENPVTPQITELKELGVTITTTPLNYNEVATYIPDLQENCFSRIFKAKERAFNSRYQAFKLEISNQSTTHYFFSPKQNNLPFVSLKNIHNAIDTTSLFKIFLGIGCLAGALLYLKSMFAIVTSIGSLLIGAAIVIPMVLVSLLILGLHSTWLEVFVFSVITIAILAACYYLIVNAMPSIDNNNTKQPISNSSIQAFDPNEKFLITANNTKTRLLFIKKQLETSSIPFTLESNNNTYDYDIILTAI